MKIYTKTGDAGETGLLGGGRATKDCVSLQAVGEIDELGAILGVVVAISGEREKELIESIQRISHELFRAGSEIAGAQMKEGAPGVVNFKLIGENEIEWLERNIDEMWVKMPELKNFILPGGSPVAAHLHLARAVCRRAERALVTMRRDMVLRPEILAYFNRLSDWLFAMARYANFLQKEQYPEIIV